MRTLLTITLFLTLWVSSALAQDIIGVATYKTQRKVEVKLDSSQMNDEMQERIQAMLRKQFQKEYTLEFTKDESMYKEVESLDKPSAPQSGGVMVMAVGSGQSDKLYYNRAEDRYANQNEMFSKQFLIKDKIEARDWQMEKESKNIGEYTCFKATYTTTRTVSSFTSSNEDGDSDSSEETREEEVTVTAWYTPQIPVSHGPDEFGGLPGLILEVSDGDLTILCSKVVLNPSKGVDITEPVKGKVVNEEEYEEIMQKKMKEMNERFQSDGRRGDGNSFQIRIGG